jgi:Xaa-Pro aminopeptidase
VSSEVYLSALTFPIAEDAELFDTADECVLRTAGDRPEEISLPALADPAADHENDALSARRADVEAKHDRIRRFLDDNGYDAVVLGRADSVSWFTSGGDLGQNIASEAASIVVFVNRTSRAILSDNVQSARVFEEELGGLGFQLKERSWYEDCGQMVAELGRGRRLATDFDGPKGLTDEKDRLRALRWPMTRVERQRLRELGRTLTLAVEATCRNFQPGETEAAIAGHLAHRLIREGVVPIDLRVSGDDRLARYRQPSFKAAPIQKYAVISATGRRHGLCASVSRIVSFGKVDRDFGSAHTLAAMVDATYIFFSRPGESVCGVFRRAQRIFEKFDHADEWTLDYQGSLIGYSARESVFFPDSQLSLARDMAVCWSPSVGPARSGDTIVIDSRGFEVVTEAQNWPKLEVMVKGFPIPRPGILER